jgi:hypothetical protein
MIKKQDDSKPEGFYSEFKINARNIVLMSAIVIIVVALLINHFK